MTMLSLSQLLQNHFPCPNEEYGNLCSLFMEERQYLNASRYKQASRSETALTIHLHACLNISPQFSALEQRLKWSTLFHLAFLLIPVGVSLSTINFSDAGFTFPPPPYYNSILHLSSFIDSTTQAIRQLNYVQHYCQSQRYSWLSSTTNNFKPFNTKLSQL